jgi:hypothetical protein
MICTVLVTLYPCWLRMLALSYQPSSSVKRVQVGCFSAVSAIGRSSINLTPTLQASLCSSPGTVGTPRRDAVISARVRSPPPPSVRSRGIPKEPPRRCYPSATLLPAKPVPYGFVMLYFAYVVTSPMKAPSSSRSGGARLVYQLTMNRTMPGC